MTTHHAICPFCGLLCDDLVVEPAGESLRPVRGACTRSRAAFASVGTPAAAAARARIAGVGADFDAALDAAAVLLRRARRPAIAGLATDVAGMRATLALARRIGAVLDHMGSPVKYRNLRVLQEFGWISTTLSEARNRADVFMLLGAGWHERYPRFVERIVAPASDLFGTPPRRRAILVDAASSACAEHLPPECEQLALGAPMDALPSLVAMLAALAAGQPADASRLAGVPSSALLQCVEWLRAARYGVVAWAAADLEMPYAELTLQALSRLLRVLNRTVRWAALPLAGTDADLTASAVHTWQVGTPYPASHANETVDFDPYRYTIHELVARREPDCLLWISSLSADRSPPAIDIPTIVLGRADTQLERAPQVYLPVATPGVDADGHLLRTDKVISLHLPRLRASALRPVAEVVQALLQRIG
jgi:formylmethanofuran dehydrogenase subunit B